MAVLVVGRVVLAAVFFVAGAAKLVDRAGAGRALSGFGVPDTLALPFGTALPVVELAIAVALVPQATARSAAGIALLLLGLFAVAIGIAVVRGREPECHCFGQLHSARAGIATLVRNFALAGVAGLITVAGPGPSVTGWIGSLSETDVAWMISALAGLIVITQVGVTVTLLQRYGRALVRVEQLESSGMAGTQQGLPVGEPAPGFELSDLDGQKITLSDLREPGLPLLLIFSDPLCGPCEVLLPTIASWQSQHADRLVMALISRGEPAANAHIREHHGIDRVVLQEHDEVDQLYLVAGTPTAVMVDAAGHVASTPALGGDQITQLVETSFRSQAPLPRRDAEPVDIPLSVLLADRSAHTLSQRQTAVNTGGSP